MEAKEPPDEDFPTNPEEFECWLSEVDKDAPTTQELTDKGGIEAVLPRANNDHEDDDEETDEEEDEVPPSMSEVKQALGVLQKGLQARGFNYAKLSKFESEVELFLGENKKQTTIDKFFVAESNVSFPL